MKKRNIWWIVTAIVVVIIAIFWFSRSKQKTDIILMSEVMQGEFEVLVTVTGELQAMNSENIMGPTELRSGVFRYGDYKIQDLIVEGTVVDSGEVVAMLDRSTAANSLQDVADAIEKAESKCLTTRLDTTMTLQGLRDELLNKKFSVEEASIKLDQSKFEPPATIRQAEIELNKAERSLEQSEVNYKLKVQQTKANMNEADIDLGRQLRRSQEMHDVLQKFTIKAPKKGMVIYHREWNGQKRKTGSTISPWDLIVATLPDLSEMISKTYVNEIDISKVRKGQKVRIGVDAFPDKKFTGEITQVANIGEQLANTDAKVFEVTIQLNEYDPILRPSMTTSNTIVINTLYDARYIPIDAIYSQDSVPFVYTRNNTKQVVVLGDTNENEVVVEQGLNTGDKIYIAVPEHSEKWKMVGEDLIPVIKEREIQKKKEREEMEKKSEEGRRKRQQGGPRGPRPQDAAPQGE